MKEKTLTLIILHIAVFLAGWTGIFGDSSPWADFRWCGTG